jgi:hypothetical protein
VWARGRSHAVPLRRPIDSPSIRWSLETLNTFHREEGSLELVYWEGDFYPQERLEPPDEGGFSMGKCRRTGRIAALAKSPPELREERGQQQQLAEAGEGDGRRSRGNISRRSRRSPTARGTSSRR